MLPLHDLLYQRLPGIPVTKLLVGVNLLVFAAMLVGGAGLWHSSNSVQLAWGANFGPATQDGEWWRLGTALFLHFGAVHLTLNLWALWDAGQLVERMYGHARFACIYFASGLAGNLLSLVAHRGLAISGGASGAIFGLFGALLIFLWRERHNLHPKEFRWFFWGAAGFALASLVLGLLITGIDNAAHIGGFFSGLLGGIIFAQPAGITERLSPRFRHIRVLAGAAFALAIVILVSQVPVRTYRWSEEVLARKEIGEFLRDDAAITQSWQSILDKARQDGTSFEELAGRIDTSVADRYEESFELLSELPPDPALPSAATVEILRHYAERRRDASRALAEGLRANKPQQIRDALEMEKQSRQLTQPEKDELSRRKQAGQE
ncbi:rhomboid protease GluP [Nitrosospira sp. Nsp11]|uniref:rhomboid family intramembrane serine protease n=1 Tax=unclassified Nitrosospira TaxID=2609267 RepID=UPI000888CAF0|nr:MULTISPECIES: rhomboid family intramembrane serine protease [unclassified Nitrosospira]SDA18263.1 rhomboid protease GluP [Nitrosospira sp. Nsp18]SHL80567.1 rhomboid protease GluP [Nitrosospira sp. Nsp11]